MKKINNRKEKGITLIALVITIIVLLILAGVAISMLSGENGILKKAADAKEKTEAAQKQEETTLKDYEVISHFTLNNSKYKCKYGYITGITVGEDVSVLKNALPNEYKIYDLDGTTELTTGVVTTGMKVKKGNDVVATIVIYGDINPNGISKGKIDGSDRAALHQYIEYDRELFGEVSIVAMDVNHDGIIDSTDRDDLSDAITPADPENPTVIIQNVEVKFVPETN